MPIVRLVLLFALFALCAPVAHGDTIAPDWIGDLREGGHVLVFRHGATYPDQADTDPLNPKNVAQQRQLNDDGRALAKAVGEAMRKMRIPVGMVLTSQFQRAVDTGTLLGYGDVTSSADISEGGLVVSPNENNRRAQALRELAATPPPAGTNVVIVTHKPNLMDAFGRDWFDIREGEASMFKPDGKGGYRLVMRFTADRWGKMAQEAK